MPLCCLSHYIVLYTATLTVPSHVYQLTLSQENVLDLQWLESSEVHPEELEAVARTWLRTSDMCWTRGTPIIEVYLIFFLIVYEMHIN